MEGHVDQKVAGAQPRILVFLRKYHAICVGELAYQNLFSKITAPSINSEDATLVVVC